MENIDLGALGAMINDQAAHISRINRERLEEAKKQVKFNNPRFEKPEDPRLPFKIKGSDENSMGYKLELYIEPRFADLVRKKIALSDDEYLDFILECMNIQSIDEFEVLKRKLLDHHNNYLWSSDVVRDFKNDCAFFAGYFDVETRMRVEDYTGVVHPILGPCRDTVNVLDAADRWNKQFIAHEQAMIDQLNKEEEQKMEVDRKLKEERERIINEGLNHHSNKVRRRTKKKFGL